MKIRQAHASRNNDTTCTCGKRYSPFLLLLSYLLIEQQQQLLHTVSYTIPLTKKRHHATTTTKTTFLNPYTGSRCSTTTSKTTSTRQQYNPIYYLQSSISSSDSIIQSNNIVSKLNINDRFGRWKYLQIILDEDEVIDYNNDIRYIICTLLEKWLQIHSQDTQDDNDDNNIPANTYKTINELLVQLNNTSSSNDVVEDDTNNIFANDISIIEKLQILLPDPIKDEDAYKSVWDTIIELNGRESVKINERTNNSNWKTRCIIARILLQYDFLTQGI